MKDPSDDSLQTISEAWKDNDRDGLSNPQRTNSKVIALLSLAAGMVLILGWSLYSMGWIQPSQPEKGDFVFESTETFLFLQALSLESDNPTATIKDMSDLQVVEKHTGDTIANATITKIENGGLTLERGDQTPTYYSREELFQKFQVAVRQDLSLLSMHPNRAALVEEFKVRLNEYALLGSTEAMDLLVATAQVQQLSKTGDQSLLGSNIPIDRLEKLLTAVRNSSLSYREKAIKNLATVDSIYALSTLGELAADGQEPLSLRIIAVKAIAERGDTAAVTALQTLQLRDGIPEALKTEVSQSLAAIQTSQK